MLSQLLLFLCPFLCMYLLSACRISQSAAGGTDKGDVNSLRNQFSIKAKEHGNISRFYPWLKVNIELSK